MRRHAGIAPALALTDKAAQHNRLAVLHGDHGRGIAVDGLRRFEVIAHLNPQGKLVNRLGNIHQDQAIGGNIRGNRKLDTDIQVIDRDVGRAGIAAIVAAAGIG